VRLIALALAAVAAALVAFNTSAAVRVASGSSSLAIPCGAPVQADWYFPAASPTGVVVLTHGWLGGKNGMAELARLIVARSGAAVVAPTIKSFDPGNGCWLLGAPMARAVASLVTARTVLQQSASAAGFSSRRGPTGSSAYMSSADGTWTRSATRTFSA
jgi:hypothetical protein